MSDKLTLAHSHHTINQQQYRDKSQVYLSSKAHAHGIEFAKIQNLIKENKLKNILDLGCGGGHVSYHAAEVAAQVTAYDLTPAMVELVNVEAQKRRLTNITTQVGIAEKLPFDDHQFDSIITRYSAHHWQNVLQSMLEMYRVLVTNGKVVVVDVLGHGNPLLNNFLQTIETLRDPSHVKDYSLSEWLYFAQITGFKVDIIEKQTLDLNFDSWVTRMNTPDNSVQVIRQLQTHCADNIKQYFQIDDCGNFTPEVLYMVLSK